jgi:hypothetical protein
VTRWAKHREYWTEVKRTVIKDGEPVVKVTTCCCALPGRPRYLCQRKSGNKTPCRCWCHSEKL